MKRIIVTVITLIAVLPAFAQGIAFGEMTFRQALDRAKAENKLVFMDCYTTWCGPCKYLSDQVFTQKEVGDFFNARLVCLKMDMEKGEGRELAARYAVKAYPTLLLIRPDGTLQHSMVGAMDGPSLIAGAREGMDEKTSFAYLEKAFGDGNRDPQLIGRYFEMLVKTHQTGKASQIADELYASVSVERLAGADYWFLFSTPALTGWNTPRCDFLLAHKAQFDRAVGKDKVDALLYEVCTDVFKCVFFDSAKGFTMDYMTAFIAGVDKIDFAGKDKVITEAEFTRAMATMDGPELLRIYKARGSDISNKGGINLFPLMMMQKAQIDKRKFPEVLQLIELVEADRFTPRK